MIDRPSTLIDLHSSQAKKVAKGPFEGAPKQLQAFADKAFTLVQQIQNFEPFFARCLRISAAFRTSKDLGPSGFQGLQQGAAVASRCMEGDLQRCSRF